MTRRFQVGDRVRIVRSTDPQMVGRVATVEKLVPLDSVAHRGSAWVGRLPDGTEMCALDIQGTIGPNWRFAYPHDYLAPVHDGDEKLSWSDERVVWKPSGVRA